MAVMWYYDWGGDQCHSLLRVPEACDVLVVHVEEFEFEWRQMISEAVCAMLLRLLLFKMVHMLRKLRKNNVFWDHCLDVSRGSEGVNLENDLQIIPCAPTLLEMAQLPVKNIRFVTLKYPVMSHFQMFNWLSDTGKTYSIGIGILYQMMRHFSILNRIKAISARTDDDTVHIYNSPRSAAEEVLNPVDEGWRDVEVIKFLDHMGVLNMDAKLKSKRIVAKFHCDSSRWRREWRRRAAAFSLPCLT